MQTIRSLAASLLAPTLAGSLLAFGLAACDLNTSPNVPPPIDLEDDTFASALGVSLSEMTQVSAGLYYRDLTVGTGRLVEAGDSIAVIYTGFLRTGAAFDSNVGASPLWFDLDELILGWKSGVPGMRVGGQRKLLIHSSLAFGSVGSPPQIPGNANLVFDIDLRDSKP